jgi:hypothetical protein
MQLRPTSNYSMQDVVFLLPGHGVEYKLPNEGPERISMIEALSSLMLSRAGSDELTEMQWANDFQPFFSKVDLTNDNEKTMKYVPVLAVDGAYWLKIIKVMIVFNYSFAYYLSRTFCWGAWWPRGQCAESLDGWPKIYYLKLLRASEGTLSRWSRLHLQLLPTRTGLAWWVIAPPTCV